MLVGFWVKQEQDWQIFTSLFWEPAFSAQDFIVEDCEYKCSAPRFGILAAPNDINLTVHACVMQSCLFRQWISSDRESSKERWRLICLIFQEWHFPLVTTTGIFLVKYPFNYSWTINDNDLYVEKDILLKADTFLLPVTVNLQQRQATGRVSRIANITKNTSNAPWVKGWTILNKYILNNCI